MCPWSWYIATTASNAPPRILTNTVSPGTGPVTSWPFARNSSISGAVTSMSWRPNMPPSPAWGLSAATAIRGRSIPSRRKVATVSSTTRAIRARVARRGTSSSAQWVETWETRKSPCASIIALSRTPVSSASISVCPAKAWPARFRASLFKGPVTIAATFPSIASRVAVATAR